MTIALATRNKPTKAVIEARTCWDQVHCSSTSAPLGKSVNGATVEYTKRDIVASNHKEYLSEYYFTVTKPKRQVARVKDHYAKKT